MTTLQNEAGRSASRRCADEAQTLLPLRWPEKPAFDWSTSLLANEAAGPNARVRTRTWLTIGHWHGNVDIAARVTDKLVDNAVKHGKISAPARIPLRMAVIPETHELMIEVDDASPDFPGFNEVAKQSGEVRGTPTGLWWVAHYRGRLSWDVKSVDGETVGKTVQAILPVT
ncbi:hypothetical protein QFZ56_002618 [Streptomyces achromogenes]|uniref:Regulatory protein n=1 Tax=Streptomyces achromogenes TaxID=67255 RepID=A0ABU0Q151_STRAH|nr:hypothetical protein [Streptomyces achromogenes]KPI22954.1 ATP-binding region ATPase domain protein [Actinobacteria bacterium OV320]MDQ0683655.1 hypothetical protein [Streptomyces achromogenes]